MASRIIDAEDVRYYLGLGKHYQEGGRLFEIVDEFPYKNPQHLGRRARREGFAIVKPVKK